MNNIVVAVDFSQSSLNAFLHALSIAQNCKTDLDLVWVRKSAEEKDKFDAESDPTKEVKLHFDELISKYQPELPGNKITCKIRTGKVYKEITDEAKESKAMLVVAGTHGASVFVEFWIGSNANRIVSLSPCPVITIREGIDINRPLARIVCPIDSTSETRQKATIHIVTLPRNIMQRFIFFLYIPQRSKQFAGLLTHIPNRLQNIIKKTG